MNKDTQSFLNEVLNALRDVQLSEPVQEIGEGDHLVADEIPDILKALYCLSVQWGRVSEEAELASRYEHDPNTKEELLSKASALAQKSKLVREIFWCDLKVTYGLWQKPIVGIRKGWKAVWREEDPPPQRIVDALAALGLKIH